MTTISSPDDFAATDPVEVAMTRRRILHAAGAVGAGVLLSGLAVDRAVAATSKKTTKKVAVSKAAACVPVPSGTGGPFPGNGTNGVNVLTEKGIVRRDIRPSFGSMTGVAAGVPLTINLVLRRASSGCAALPNAAVYIWHCDAIGQYSLYSIETENYLRGVQVADAKGALSFVTSFPGAYPGRWPHVHFEVYADLASASKGRNAIKTSQLALPGAACKAVYAESGYDGSAASLASTPLARDSQFRDGWATQMPTVSGDAKKGFSANLVVNV